MEVSLSSQSVVPSAAQVSRPLHIHIPDEECPACGQVIPPEKLEEVKGKIASKERERALAITTDLESRFQRERAEQLADWQRSLDAAADARKKAEERNAALQATLAQSESDNLVAVEAAKIQGKREADELAAVKFAEARSKHLADQATLLQEVETAKAATEEAKASTQGAVDLAVAEKVAEADTKHLADRAALLEEVETARAATEEAKAATQKAVELAVAEKVAEADTKHNADRAALLGEVESARAAIEEAKAATQKAVDLAVAEKVAEADTKPELIQVVIAELLLDTKHTADQAALQTRLAEAEARVAVSDEQARLKQEASEAALAAANAAAAEASAKLITLQEEQAATLTRTLEEQREILDKASGDALNAQAARHFVEHQKLTTKLGEVTRDLEKKTNEELGEGAEVDLYEALKSEFPGDRITRVKKGVTGGDVLHVIVTKGRDCGTIIYDSKNHKSWLSEHVSKLKTDQLAANAEYAILSTHKFPKGD